MGFATTRSCVSLCLPPTFLHDASYCWLEVVFSGTNFCTRCPYVSAA